MGTLRRRALFVVLAALASVGALRGVRRVARAFLFPVTLPGARADDAPAPRGVVRHAWTAKDGVAVHALELPAENGARTVVYFHNNRESAATRIELARALHARGLGVLLVEYRGYGESRGAAPTEDGLYLDAECALDMLEARGVGADRVVLWGTSLGTGVAAEMARRGRGARLVLEAPYTSIPALVTDAAPIVPASLLVEDRFDTLAKSGEIRVPTLVVHGDADEVVPFWMGERLSNAIRGARLVRVPGAHHGDLFARDGEHILAAIAAIAS